jgi:hypothetical protein
MFDIISDYNSVTSSGCIGRMTSMIGYVVLESDKKFFNEMHFWYKTYVSILCAQDYL